MTSKKLLLAGIAASAAFATQAGAITLSAFPAGGVATGTGTFSSTNPYTLAQELNYTSGISGAFVTVASLGSGTSALIAGNTYQLTVTYNGATLTNGAMPSDLTFNNGTAAPAATGFATTATGGVGSSTAVYTITVGNTAPVGDFYIDILPTIKVNSNSGMTVTASLTSNGNTVSPTASTQLITAAPAFSVGVTPDMTGPTYSTGTGFTTLSANTAIGTVALVVAPNLKQDLAGTGVTAATSSETINVTGDFSQLNVTGSLSGTTFGAPTGGTETSTFTSNSTAASDIISVAINNGTATASGAIPASGYTATASFTLAGPTFSPNVITGSGAFQTVTRAGYSAIVPWVSSATQSASTGSSSVIRISTIHGTAGGTVYAELLTNTAGITGGLKAIGTLPTGGELVLASQDLENAFGNFQRGDFRLTVASPTAASVATGIPGSSTVSGIIVKRVIARSTGLTEMANLNEAATTLDPTTATAQQTPPSH